SRGLGDVYKRQALRLLCSSAQGVSGAIKWIRRNQLSFAVRAGGHSYEGYCNNKDVVIDVRGMVRVDFNPNSKRVTVGAGATLGSVYEALRDEKVGFVAGSCPTVGVAGHTLGGGYGFLARAYGLACDNLISLTMVDAQGSIISANATTNADLFWAHRGGGGGSLGIVTELTFKTHRVSDVSVFRVVWSGSRLQARRVIERWQAWAPRTDPAITSLLKVGKASNGEIALRCVGQSIGSPADLRRELEKLAAVAAPSQAINIRTGDFHAAVKSFAGNGDDLDKFFTKEKSDYVSALSRAGIDAALDQLSSLPSGRIVLLLNAYGGAINAIKNDDTAFPYRTGVGFLIHYYSQWGSASLTATRLRQISAFYAAMRPYVSGGAYVNYCDADLPNWPTAYWGPNLARLKAVKLKYDPMNVFRHGQSIPPP
ncbi:MAG: FAD-binding oxidoreductase, partial [Methylocystis sp.]|nr:FAD-binding oxidoreductase [Methylocystis sp.]